MGGQWVESSGQMSVGRGLRSPLGVEYRDAKIVGNFSMSADGHSVGKRHPFQSPECPLIKVGVDVSFLWRPPMRMRVCA